MPVLQAATEVAGDYNPLRALFLPGMQEGVPEGVLPVRAQGEDRRALQERAAGRRTGNLRGGEVNSSPTEMIEPWAAVYPFLYIGGWKILYLIEYS